MTKPTAVYRIYNDTGQLLYVGISTHPLRRQKQHSLAQDWWYVSGACRMEWETYETRKSAERAEIAAIRAEQPAYNKNHKPAPGVEVNLKHPPVYPPIDPPDWWLDYGLDIECVYDFSFAQVASLLHWTEQQVRVQSELGVLNAYETQFGRRVSVWQVYELMIKSQPEWTHQMFGVMFASDEDYERLGEELQLLSTVSESDPERSKKWMDECFGLCARVDA